MSETKPSGARPPIVPPIGVALGGGGAEDDGEFLRSFRSYLDVLRLTSAYPKESPLPAEVNADANAALESLDALLQHGGPEFRAQAIIELSRQRADLAEQLELERLVARPARKGYDLIHPEDDLPTALERTIGLVDTILGILEKKE